MQAKSRWMRPPTRSSSSSTLSRNRSGQISGAGFEAGMPNFAAPCNATSLSSSGAVCTKGFKGRTCGAVAARHAAPRGFGMTCAKLCPAICNCPSIGARRGTLRGVSGEVDGFAIEAADDTGGFRRSVSQELILTIRYRRGTGDSRAVPDAPCDSGRTAVHLRCQLRTASARRSGHCW